VTKVVGVFVRFSCAASYQHHLLLMQCRAISRGYSKQNRLQPQISVLATAPFFPHNTFAKPILAAKFSASFFCSMYQGTFYKIKNLPYYY
jgi:hypothetical protein